MNYRISVLTSIYKSSEFLFDFLLDAKRQSIFNQIEFLLLDANEDNADYKIIEPFLFHKNFKYKKIGKCNVYEAWNIGIELSSAPILTNWNTDDRRSYNSLDIQASYLEKNPEVDLCYGNLKISNNPNEIFEHCNSNKYWPCYEGTLENQLKHNSPHCLPVWRKDIHGRFGKFDTNYFCVADYDMWFRILQGGGKLKYIRDIVGVYYENPNSISRNPLNYQKAIKEVIEIKKKYS